MPDLERRKLKLADLKPHPENYNRHSQEQISLLMQSLEQFGQVRPIVVHRNLIIAGEGLSTAARRLHWEEIDAYIFPDATPDHIVRGYMVADNQHASNADPDRAALLALTDRVLAEDAALLAALGFTDDSMDSLRLYVNDEFNVTFDPMQDHTEKDVPYKAVDRVVVVVEHFDSVKTVISEIGQLIRDHPEWEATIASRN